MAAVDGGDHLSREALAIDAGVYGETGSAAMATHLYQRGAILLQAGRADEAQALFEQCLTVSTRLLGTGHALVTSTRRALAGLAGDLPSASTNE